MENLIRALPKWKAELAAFLPGAELRAFAVAFKGQSASPRPVFHAGLSRTHTREYGLELELPASAMGSAIGIDLEVADRRLSASFNRFADKISPLDPPAVREQLDNLERWAIKEACYKASFPQPSGLLLSGFALQVRERLTLPDGTVRVEGTAHVQLADPFWEVQCQYLLLACTHWKVAFAKRLD